MGRAFLVLVMVAACGDDDGVPMDLGVSMDAAIDASLPILDEAAEPAPPEIACPPNWLQAIDGNLGLLCDVTASITGDGCRGIEARFAGAGADCRPIGSVCDDPLPARPNPVFVRLGSSGDGSAERPFGTLQEAADAAAPGGTIFVEPGEYVLEDTLTLDGVSLRGRCVEGVQIRAPNDRNTIVVRGEVRLQNVHIRDGASGITVAEGGALDASFIVVRNVGNWGLGISPGAEATVDRAIFRNDEDIFVGERSVGMLAQGVLNASNVVVRGFDDVQVVATGEDARLTLADAVLGAYEEGKFRFGGSALRVLGGASAEVFRTEASFSRGSCFRASGAGSRLECTQCTAALCGEGGFGIVAVEGAEVIADQASVFENTFSVGAIEAGSSLLLTNSQLSVASAASEETGVGVVASGGGVVTMRRVESVFSLQNEVRVGAGSVVRMEDVRLAHTLNEDDEADLTSAISVTRDGELRMTRVRIEEAADISLRLSSGARVDGEDVVIERSSFDEVTGFGAAIFASGGELNLTRLAIRAPAYAGAIFVGEDIAADLRMVRIEDVAPSPCVDRRCADYLGGVGLAAYAGARVGLRDFLIDGATVGVHVAAAERSNGSFPPGVLSLSGGAILRTQVALSAADLEDPATLLDGTLVQTSETPVETAERTLALP